MQSGWGVPGRNRGTQWRPDLPVTAAADLQPVMAKIMAVLECNAQNIVDHVQLAPGSTRSIPFAVAPSEDDFKALGSWASGDVAVSLTRPDGTTMNESELRPGERWDAGPSYASGIGMDPQRGAWSFNLTAAPANLATIDITINVWGGEPVAAAPAPASVSPPAPDPAPAPGPAPLPLPGIPAPSQPAPGDPAPTAPTAPTAGRPAGRTCAGSASDRSSGRSADARQLPCNCDVPRLGFGGHSDMATGRGQRSVARWLRGGL